MSLIISTGSNLGDKLFNLLAAKEKLSQEFELCFESDIFESKAVDFLDQPDFYNQLLEFKLPNKLTPQESLEIILKIELELGRKREIPKGPRSIDIDIIFWDTKHIATPGLSIPHPEWDKRSFIVQPLQQLPFFKTLEKCFKIPNEFNNEAYSII